MRYDYIDIARGLAMLVVINWHILDIHKGHLKKRVYSLLQ